MLCFCSSQNAKKWEVELQTLKNNNARLTTALQESNVNVDEWKRQLASYKEENATLKKMVGQTGIRWAIQCAKCVDCRLLLANSLTHSLTYKHCWIITTIQSPTSNMAITYSPVRQLHKSTSLFIAQGCETLHLLPHILLFISYSPVRQLYNFVTHLFICAQHLLISQSACFLHQNQCLTFN